MKKFLDKIIPSGITAKLSLYISVFIVVAFTLLQTYNFLNLKSEIKNQINKEQYTQAKFIAKDIQNKIEERTVFLSALAENISTQKTQSEAFLIDTFKNHIGFTDFFPQGFAFIRPDGVGVIAEYPTIPGRKNLIFTDSEWLIRAKNSEGVIISLPFRSKVLGEVLVIIAKALRDKHGRLLGILEAPIFLNRPGFMEYIFKQNFSERSDILVVSRSSQTFLASSQPSLLLKPMPKKEMVGFFSEVMGGLNGYGNMVNDAGESMLTAAADINSPDWFVMVRAPVKKVYQTINESLRVAIINGLIVSFSVFLTITFFLYLFFNPLKEAAKSVKNMVLHKKTLSHIKGYKNDEIGDLIIGFNAVIDMVNERNDKLEKSNAMFESLSQIDGLTKAFNRRWLDYTLNQLWQAKTRSQAPLTLLLIDVDYFKKFNDAYGHIAGDDCLIKIAKTIQETLCRPTDFFARYGGEEFVILLESDIEEGFEVAEKVRLAISHLKITHSESSYKYVTISLGVASVIPKLNSKPIELLKQADLALYESKEGGRNRYESYLHKS